jgi:hypothetical protein
MTFKEQMLTIALYISSDEAEYEWFKKQVIDNKWEVLKKTFDDLINILTTATYWHKQYDLVGYLELVKLAKQALHYKTTQGIQNYAETKFKNIQKHYL